MEDVAGWIAPFATIVAAMMTAANLGPRITGWGFVVFLLGSVSWCTVALLSNQPNLLWANGVLVLVNCVGIWRWLGRLAKFGDGARHARKRKDDERVAPLFSAGDLIDRPLLDPAGSTIGHAIGAMVRNDNGGIAYLVVSEGGIGGMGERLHAIAWQDVTMRGASPSVGIDARALAALPVIDPQQWPTTAPSRFRATGTQHRSSQVIAAE